MDAAPGDPAEIAAAAAAIGRVADAEVKDTQGGITACASNRYIVPILVFPVEWSI